MYCIISEAEESFGENNKRVYATHRSDDNCCTKGPVNGCDIIKWFE